MYVLLMDEKDEKFAAIVSMGSEHALSDNQQIQQKDCERYVC